MLLFTSLFVFKFYMECKLFTSVARETFQRPISLNRSSNTPPVSTGTGDSRNIIAKMSLFTSLIIPSNMRRKVLISLRRGANRYQNFLTRAPPLTRGMKRSSSRKSRNETYTNFWSRIWKFHQIPILTTFCNQKMYFVFFQLLCIKR